MKPGYILALAAMLAAVGPALYAQPDTDYKIERKLMDRLADDEEAIAPFFVVFGERPNLTPAYRMNDRAARGRFVAQSLQATASRSQNGVRGYLQGRKVDFTPFWIENKIYVPSGTLDLARALARRPEVVAIIPEIIHPIPQPRAAAQVGTQAIEWNISKIGADSAWSITRGAGAVVANIDTGVQYTHPALVNQYRGTATGSHTGNWKDPSGACAAPCDNNGHGTHTMGTMVGYDAATSRQIGVAPGAKWIACKGCRTNSCIDSDLLACAEWVADPAIAPLPNAVNNSWGGLGGDNWYQTYVTAWRAAGIFPAFANGNAGPGCSTAGSPGDYSNSFAVGATDGSDTIASFSSRGPAVGTNIIKPDASAPGVDVTSSVPTNSYATWSGTSMATPHVAGAVALIVSAASSYQGNISAIEGLLKSTAWKLPTTQNCGGTAGLIPNNTYGAGRIDVFNAVTTAGGTQPPPAPTVTITAPAYGAAFACPAAVTFTGSTSETASSIAWTDNGTPFGSGSSLSKNYSCTETGNHLIDATVTRGSISDTDTITISIVNTAVPAAPSNLSASVSNRTVTLTWNSSVNATSYKVERKPKSGGTWTVIGSPTAPTYSDTPGKGNWSYRVRAYNVAGQSAPSNVVTVRVN